MTWNMLDIKSIEYGYQGVYYMCTNIFINNCSFGYRILVFWGTGEWRFVQSISRLESFSNFKDAALTEIESFHACK